MILPERKGYEILYRMVCELLLSQERDDAG